VPVDRARAPPARHATALAPSCLAASALTRSCNAVSLSTESADVHRRVRLVRSYNVAPGRRRETARALT
ncbi:uncharacterized, partial [Tachysurus ichikawai]